MRLSRFLVATLLALAMIALAGGGAAHAHAILIDSQPPAGGAAIGPHVTIHLRFNSRIDRARSRLTLTAPDHAQSVLAVRPDDPPDVMTAPADLGPGAYTLRWQVLAVDGHITRGDVPFTVTPGS